MAEFTYSIVIPVYNSALYIEKCLNSILNQDYDKFQVIIVDDGSTDDSLQILNDFAKDYPNVIVLSQDNAGPGAARELALKYATGDYIIFSDSDDYWEDNFLSKINIYIEKYLPDILEFGYRKVELNGRVISNYPLVNTQYKNDYCIKHYINQKNTTNFLWNKVFSKKLFSNVKFLHLYAGEDSAVLLQLFSNAKSYVSIPEICYNHVMTPLSLCRLPFNMKKLDILKSDDFMYEYLSKKHKDLCEKFAYAVCARSAILYCELLLSEDENKNSLKHIIKNQYKKYRSYIKNPKKASKSFSIKRKGIVTLFGINPVLCIFAYKIIKKLF